MGMLNMNMGLGGQGGYQGPVFGSAASVQASGGYPDTGPGRAMTFGPGGMGGGGGGSPVHALAFGVLCVVGLVLLACTLPR
jgi:hypothetical protein